MAKTIKNAVMKGYLYYAAVQSPTHKYECEGSKDPLDYEYTVQVLTDPKTATEFGKLCKKQKPKKVNAEEFEKQFKVAPPSDMDPDKNGNYYIVRLKSKNAYEKEGEVNLLRKPEVFMVNSDGKLVVDSDTLIGNGSKGAAQYVVKDYGKFGVTASLQKVRVDDLVEYGNDENLLGDVAESEEPSLGADDEFEEVHDDDAPFDPDEDDDEY